MFNEHYVYMKVKSLWQYFWHRVAFNLGARLLVFAALRLFLMPRELGKVLVDNSLQNMKIKLHYAHLLQNYKHCCMILVSSYSRSSILLVYARYNL